MRINRWVIYGVLLVVLLVVYLYTKYSGGVIPTP
jgi:hypothetical protein